MERFGQKFCTYFNNTKDNVLKENLMGINLLCNTGNTKTHLINKDVALYKSDVSGIDTAHIMA